MTPAMISACERYISTTPRLGAPVYFPGMDINKDVSTYVRFFVVPSEDTLPLGLGETAKKRNVGVVQATIYGPRGKGAGQTGALAMTIWKRFTRKPLEVTDEGWITFKEGSIKDMGDTGEEHIQIVRIPYSYDFQIQD